MINRRLETQLQALWKYFPVISVTGPRQSGKTTLVKHTFPKLPYASLEDPENDQFSKNDPRGFLANFPEGAVIDEAQKSPQLFSYIQGIVDDNKKIRFILSGSQNFLLSSQISQSLAGRVGILNLLPFSMSELKIARLLGNDVDIITHRGFYPPIFDRKIPPRDFYANYVHTYVERDVRQLLKIMDLSAFSLFLRLCAGRVGQLLNLSELANDAGITVNTAKSWIGILEASFILFRLQPYHKNFNKRIIKMPKLYFYDTGLVCYLLGIKDPQQLSTHYAKGAIFENLIILELIKRSTHTLFESGMYFWRDHRGKEIDLLLESGESLIPIEIKSGITKKGAYFEGLDYWNKISGNNPENSYAVYAGKEDQVRSNGKLLSWKSVMDYDFFNDEN